MSSKLDRFKCKSKPSGTLITRNFKGTFAVHPDESRVEEGVFVIQDEYNRWYLVDAALYENSVYIEGLLRADLFDCIDSEGKRFLLVNTYPLTQEMTAWRKSINKIVDKARKDWVTMKRFDDKVGWGARVNDDVDHDPQWPKQAMDDFVLKAFGERVIYDVEDVPLALIKPAKSGKKQTRRDIEEDDD